MKLIHTPRVSTRYWTAIALASVFGTNLGDFYAHESGLGIVKGLSVLALIAGFTFVIERFDEHRHELYYWAVILIIRTGATNIADYLAYGARIPRLLLTVSLAGLIALFGWASYRTMRSSITSFTLNGTNASYWLAMLSAGVFGMQVLTEVTEAEFARIFSVNVLGTLLMTQAVARAMIARGRGGTVVNIASGAGRRPAPGSVVYSASKAAVISLTQCAALELIPHGIRVNAIAPGAVRTPMWNQVESLYAATLGPGTGTAEAAQVALTPIGRMSTPEEYVGGAIYLACEDSAYVVGQTLNVDGGMNLG